ncbi:hypothetical protein H9P43_010043 [Blastocladiella emersonii ATCC 22665]|nr:hypothetical protein H9P43_010043 [Blastocladiella emersonii ATCC 22665]
MTFRRRVAREEAQMFREILRQSTTARIEHCHRRALALAGPQDHPTAWDAARAAALGTFARAESDLERNLASAIQEVNARYELHMHKADWYWGYRVWDESTRYWLASMQEYETGVVEKVARAVERLHATDVCTSSPDVPSFVPLISYSELPSSPSTSSAELVQGLGSGPGTTPAPAPAYGLHAPIDLAGATHGLNAPVHLPAAAPGFHTHAAQPAVAVGFDLFTVQCFTPLFATLRSSTCGGSEDVQSLAILAVQIKDKEGIELLIQLATALSKDSVLPRKQFMFLHIRDQVRGVLGITITFYDSATIEAWCYFHAEGGGHKAFRYLRGPGKAVPAGLTDGVRHNAHGTPHLINLFIPDTRTVQRKAKQDLDKKNPIGLQYGRIEDVAKYVTEQKAKGNIVEVCVAFDGTDKPDEPRHYEDGIVQGGPEFGNLDMAFKLLAEPVHDERFKDASDPKFALPVELIDKLKVDELNDACDAAEQAVSEFHAAPAATAAAAVGSESGGAAPAPATALPGFNEKNKLCKCAQQVIDTLRYLCERANVYSEALAEKEERKRSKIESPETSDASKEKAKVALAKLSAKRSRVHMNISWLELHAQQLEQQVAMVMTEQGPVQRPTKVALDLLQLIIEALDGAHDALVAVTAAATKILVFTVTDALNNLQFVVARLLVASESASIILPVLRYINYELKKAGISVAAQASDGSNANCLMGRGPGAACYPQMVRDAQAQWKNMEEDALREWFNCNVDSAMSLLNNSSDVKAKWNEHYFTTWKKDVHIKAIIKVRDKLRRSPSATVTQAAFTSVQTVLWIDARLKLNPKHDVRRVPWVPVVRVGLDGQLHEIVTVHDRDHAFKRAAIHFSESSIEGKTDHTLIDKIIKLFPEVLGPKWKKRDRQNVPEALRLFSMECIDKVREAAGPNNEKGTGLCIILNTCRKLQDAMNSSNLGIEQRHQLVDEAGSIFYLAFLEKWCLADGGSPTKYVSGIPTCTITALFSIIGAFKAFDERYVRANPGPNAKPWRQRFLTTDMVEAYFSGCRNAWGQDGRAKSNTLPRIVILLAMSKADHSAEQLAKPFDERGGFVGSSSRHSMIGGYKRNTGVWGTMRGEGWARGTPIAPAAPADRPRKRPADEVEGGIESRPSNRGFHRNGTHVGPQS